MKPRLLFFLIPLLIAFVTLGAQLKPLPPKLSTADLMKAKLTASQKVLEGIATEDFNGISRNASLLAGYSQTAGWLADQSPAYRQYTTEFRRQALALAKEARRQNLDGATVAYFQLTVSCVNCHKYMRAK